MNFQAMIASWCDTFESDGVAAAMPTISDGLWKLRSSLSAAEWNAIVESSEMEQLRRIAHECPYSARGFIKPRGYAGDAVLLDYIYGGGPTPETTTPRGREILSWMKSNSSGFRSVIWRRNHFANMIDEVADRKPGAQVASIACGHFREGQRSLALRQGKATAIAFDQDVESLAVVAAEQGDFGVQTMPGSVRDLLGNRLDLSGLDLIYAAGLYDYLEVPLARRLTRRLFERLNPGGQLIVANFHSMWEAGWMEAMMKWKLIYRDQTEVQRFASEIEPEEIARSFVYADPNGSVLYSSLQKS